MKYAVLSDSHDNLPQLTKALEEMLKRNIIHGFHLGDFCAPWVLTEMVKYEHIAWTCVFGNVDGEKFWTADMFKNHPRISILGEQFRELDISGKKIFLTHFPLLAENAADSGKYAAVFHGHTHKKRMENLQNGTLLANPGEILGYRSGISSFGVWDSDSNEFTFVEL